MECEGWEVYSISQWVHRKEVMVEQRAFVLSRKLFIEGGKHYEETTVMAMRRYLHYSFPFVTSGSRATNSRETNGGKNRACVA